MSPDCALPRGRFCPRSILNWSWAASFWIACLLSPETLADPPALEHLFPAGAPLGTTNRVQIEGKWAAWPITVWTDSPEITASAETNKAFVQIVIGTNAVPGAHWVRIYDDEGASEPRIFVAGTGIEIADTEPNDSFAKAQALERLPVTINGRLDKSGDVDSFSVHLRKGEWLCATVDSYTLMSTVDALLRLVTNEGRQLAWNHDDATLDPRLVWQAPVDGEFVLQLMGFKYPADSNVQLTGGSGCVYRLHVSADVCRPASRIGPISESEPNDTAETAQALNVPDDVVIGCVDSGADEDRYRFSVKKGQTIEAAIEAAKFGSPLDAWLAIEDLKGNSLARADDSGGSPDPRLEWRAAEDGPYIATVGNLLHEGGDAFRYRLFLGRVKPDFEATALATSVAIRAGETNRLQVNISRLRGDTNRLEIHAERLPDGISAAPVTVSEKGGDVSLEFVAATNAPSFNGSISISVRDLDKKESRGISASLTATGYNNGVPGGYRNLLIESLDSIWLTVRPAEPKSAGAASAESSGNH